MEYVRLNELYVQHTQYLRMCHMCASARSTMKTLYVFIMYMYMQTDVMIQSVHAYICELSHL